MQPQRQTAGDFQRRLIQALRNPACYPHPVGRISVIETHISFVVLTGTFAYKIKKPVDLGFLDFTTLEKRRFYCQEELRLNARFAPRVYLGVVTIGGTSEIPRVGDDTQAIEYAVKMREFPQEVLADRALARGELTPLQFDALAGLVAQFHAGAPASGEGDAYGTPDAILGAVAQNFSQIRAVPQGAQQLPVVDRLETWARQEHARLRQVLARRKRDGRVRECHGDLHLGNIVLLDGALQPFDCIEFNPDLRWIDVMNEVAFLVMDLHAADRAKFARRFLNAYLESCGDYDGLHVLAYYFAYRAMVRAKIGLMRVGQLETAHEGAAPQRASCQRYLDLAGDCARPRCGFVAITHGFSGSGKTSLSECLVELAGAIRIRSDVERKRMNSMSPTQRGEAQVASALYAAGVTDTTYRRLVDLAGIILDSGYGVIVDATFLRRRHRDMFRGLARRADVAFVIVDFTAPVEVLRDRVAGRLQQGQDASDADLAVLEHQIGTHEALEDEERTAVVTFDTGRPVRELRDPRAWNAVLRMLPARPD
jgi:uncharacterized protein